MGRKREVKPFWEKHPYITTPVIAGVFAIIAVILTYSLSNTEPSVIQHNNGSGQGIINSGSGDITIEQYGLTKEQNTILLTILQGLGDNKKADERLLNHLLNQIDEKDTSIIEKERFIQEQSIKIRELLASESISNELKTFIRAGDLDGAERLVDQHYEEVVKPEEKALAQKLYERANIKIINLKYAVALKSLEKAVLLDPESLYYSRDYGLLNLELGYNDKALEYLQSYLKLAIKNTGISSPVVADAHTNIGAVFLEKRNFQTASTYFNLSLKSNIEFFGVMHPTVANDYNNLASTYMGLKEYDKSIKYFELALQSNIANFGDKHPKVAINQINLGAAWQYKKQHRKAIKYFEKALKIDIETYGDNHPQVAHDLLNLGSVWYQLEQYSVSVDYHKSALKIYLEIYGADHPKTKLTVNNLNAAIAQLKGYPI